MVDAPHHTHSHLMHPGETEPLSISRARQALYIAPLSLPAPLPPALPVALLTMCSIRGPLLPQLLSVALPFPFTSLPISLQ